MPRRLGQHFLIHDQMAAKIVRALGAPEGAGVLEIGPGKGALTRFLLKRCGRLVLVEKDPALVSELEERFGKDPRVTILLGDASKMDLKGVVLECPFVIGNLPFETATAILVNLLQCPTKTMVLTFQREVAQRLSARPGERAFGPISTLVQMRAKVEHLFDLSPMYFRPPPKVTSSVLRFKMENDNFLDLVANQDFLDLLHALHSSPRKTVLNSLAHGARISSQEARTLLSQAGIDPGLRPCAVSPQEAIALFHLWRSLKLSPTAPRTGT